LELGFPFLVFHIVKTFGFSQFSTTTRGYKGKAMITPCSKSGQPYKISGCTPKLCLAPPELEKQDYQATAGDGETAALGG
jgi:hypothetical protein